MTPPNVALYNWIRQGLQFGGRSSRSEYWWVQGFVLLVQFVLLVAFLSSIGPDASEALNLWLEEIVALSQAGVSAAQDVEAGAAATVVELPELPLELRDLPRLAVFFLTFGVVFTVLTIIPNLSLSWRRFQDMNMPGWLHLVFLVAYLFVPLVLLLELVWFIRRGTRGPNKFGADPTEMYL